MPLPRRKLHSEQTNAIHTLLEDPIYKDKWLPVDALVEGVNSLLEANPLLETNEGVLSSHRFNRRMSTLFGDAACFDANQSGVFRRFSGKMYYYIKSPDKGRPHYPDVSPSWKEMVEMHTAELDRRKRQQTLPEDDTPQTDDSAAATGVAEPRSKRQKTDSCESTKPIKEQTYWDSNEAHELFPPNEELDASVEAGVARRIKKLQLVSSTMEGWKLVVKADDEYSDSDVFVVRQLAQLLCRTYQLALELKPKGGSWESIYQRSCDDLNGIGIWPFKSTRAMKKWHRLFIQNNDTFPHPRSNKKPET